MQGEVASSPLLIGVTMLLHVQNEDMCVAKDPRPPEQVEEAAARKLAFRQKKMNVDLQVSVGLDPPEGWELEQRQYEEEEQRGKEAMVVQCACDLLLVFGTSLKVQVPICY